MHAGPHGSRIPSALPVPAADLAADLANLAQAPSAFGSRYELSGSLASLASLAQGCQPHAPPAISHSALVPTANLGRAAVQSLTRALCLNPRLIICLLPLLCTALSLPARLGHMSLLTYPMPVPAGQHPPFAVVTPTDHRAWIFVSAALGISLTFMSLGVRAFVRYATRVALGYDDAALMFSIVCIPHLDGKTKEPSSRSLRRCPFGREDSDLVQLLAVLQTSLILAATSKGLGESFFRVDAHQRSTLQHVSSMDTEQASPSCSRQHFVIT